MEQSRYYVSFNYLDEHHTFYFYSLKFALEFISGLSAAESYFSKRVENVSFGSEVLEV